MGLAKIKKDCRVLYGYLEGERGIPVQAILPGTPTSFFT
jgi:hypothetical protein